jgi:hypothetical protein
VIWVRESALGVELFWIVASNRRFVCVLFKSTFLQCFASRMVRGGLTVLCGIAGKRGVTVQVMHQEYDIDWD